MEDALKAVMLASQGQLLTHRFDSIDALEIQRKTKLWREAKSKTKFSQGN